MFGMSSTALLNAWHATSALSNRVPLIVSSPLRVRTGDVMRRKKEKKKRKKKKEKKKRKKGLTSMGSAGTKLGRPSEDSGASGPLFW